MENEKQRGYVDTSYLQFAAEALDHIKLDSYKLLDLEEGSRVLDVGCGPGTDTIRLASLTGPSGIVIGIDLDPEMVAEADKRAAEAGVKEWVEHTQGSAASLPFGDGVFSACRSERLLQHLPDPLPQKVLSEMVRVTEAGGKIVVVDNDYASQSVNTRESSIERRIAQWRTEKVITNGYIARSLPTLFKEAGLVDIDIEVYPVNRANYNQYKLMSQSEAVEADAVRAGILTDAEVDLWRADLEAQDAAGTFFANVNILLVSGRKPSG